MKAVILAVVILCTGCAYHAPTEPTPPPAPTPTPSPTPAPIVPAIEWGLMLTVSPQPVVAGQTVFVSSIITGHVAPAPVTYRWVVTGQADQAGSNAQIGVTFGAPGNYQVNVDATDGAGRTVSAQQSIIVDAPKPTPAPTPTPAPVPVTLAVTLGCTPATPTPCNVAATFGSEVVTSKIVKVTWDWGDGGAIQTVLGTALAQHSYAQPGVYLIIATVTATTTASGEQTGIASKSITIP